MLFQAGTDQLERKTEMSNVSKTTIRCEANDHYDRVEYYAKSRHHRLVPRKWRDEAGPNPLVMQGLNVS